MKYFIPFLVGAFLLSGCGTMQPTSAGGSGQGTTVNRSVSVGSRAQIDGKMEKKAAELASLEQAQVETVKASNGLKSIKVTFDSGALFDFNKITLKESATGQLDRLVELTADMPDTHFSVSVHTDNIGSEKSNITVSSQRAEAVSRYLQSKGIAKKRLTAVGQAARYPVASNSTEEGRAKNRRVEIVISANN